MESRANILHPPGEKKYTLLRPLVDKEARPVARMEEMEMESNTNCTKVKVVSRKGCEGRCAGRCCTLNIVIPKMKITFPSTITTQLERDLIKSYNRGQDVNQQRSIKDAEDTPHALSEASLSLSQPLLQSLLKRSLNEVLNPLEKELKKLEYLSKQHSERGRELIVCSGQKLEESPNEENCMRVTDARPRQCSALRSKLTLQLIVDINCTRGVSHVRSTYTYPLCALLRLSPVHCTEHCCIR